MHYAIKTIWFREQTVAQGMNLLEIDTVWRYFYKGTGTIHL